MPILPLLSTLISSGGLPVVAKLLGGVLSKKDGALKEAGDLLLANSNEINTQLSSKDNVKLALAELENEKSETEGQYELLVEQQKTQRSELASTSVLARNWRPVFGLVLAGAWGVQMLAITISVVFFPELSSGIIDSFGSLTAQWAMGFAAVGVNISSRSRDKKLQAHSDAGVSPPASLIESIITRLK